MTPAGGSVSGPIRLLGASLLALGRIRLELLAIEVQEEKERIASLLLWAALTGLMAGFAAVFVTLFATVALWDTHRLAALGVAALLFVALAALGVLRMQRLIASRATPFHSSIAELSEDGSALRQGPKP